MRADKEVLDRRTRIKLHHYGSGTRGSTSWPRLKLRAKLLSFRLQIVIKGDHRTGGKPRIIQKDRERRTMRFHKAAEVRAA